MLLLLLDRCTQLSCVVVSLCLVHKSRLSFFFLSYNNKVRTFFYVFKFSFVNSIGTSTLKLTKVLKFHSRKEKNLDPVVGCSNSENANKREPIIRGAHLVIESDNEGSAHT